MITADQLVAHAIGDYVIQSDWMAGEKTRQSFAAAVHALTYAWPFLLLTHSLPALAVIVGTHFVIDRWRLARFVVFAKNFLGPPSKWPRWSDCTATGIPERSASVARGLAADYRGQPASRADQRRGAEVAVKCLQRRVGRPSLTTTAITVWLQAMCIVAWAACGPAPAPDPGITRACVRSFRPALQAWEREHGRVPDDCAYLDAVYPVQLVSAEELPCEDEPGSIVVGCIVRDDAIYLLEDRLPAQLVDTSVHEWVHALAGCVDGDIDAEHLRGELWRTYGPNTVEFAAQTAAEIGACE